MKKNRMMRLASILLVCVLLSTSVISGTFAKYTSTVSGSDVATVADWNIQFKAGNGEATKLGYTNTVVVDLFSTVKDSDGTSNETDVAGGKLIAPGTSGSFKFSIENDSEVTARYKIDYQVTNAANIPIEFSVNNGQTWTTDIADVAFTTLEMNSAATEVVVMWRWAFEGTNSKNFQDSQTDLTDTTLGLAGEATVTVAIAITAEQVD